jgi:uncharacterized OsmC-like protein
VENSGTDAGMSPPELLLASLGTCAMYYAVEYLRTRSLPVEGVAVRVTAEKAAKPARLGSFRIHLQAPRVGEQHIAGLERAVKHCLVHNTLLNTPAIETVIERAGAAEVWELARSARIGMWSAKPKPSWRGSCSPGIRRPSTASWSISAPRFSSIRG